MNCAHRRLCRRPVAGQSGKRAFRDGMGHNDSWLGDVTGICVDPFDTVYFCDYAHCAIRAISPEGGVSLCSLCCVQLCSAVSVSALLCSAIRVN